MAFVLLLAVFISVQGRSEDCTVGKALPLLSSRDSLKRDQEKNVLTESAQIDKDITLVVESGGCYHYGAKLTFTLRSPSRRHQALLAEAAELMSRVRLIASNPVARLIADVVPRMRNRAKGNYVSGDPIQDSDHEMETIYVSEETDKSVRRVIVVYSNTL
jgi:hypothetical protein